MADIAKALIEWLLWQSLYATVAAAVIFGLIGALRIRDPRWLMGLWAIVLLRFLLPTDFAMPWGIGSIWDQFGPAVLDQRADGGEIAASVPSVERLGVGGGPVASGSLAIFLTLIWAGGALGLFFIVLRQQLKTSRLLRRAAPAGQEVRDRLRHWQRKFDIDRPVHMVVGDAKLLPFTTGLLSPAIFMSRQHLETIGRDELDAVLVHELAHIRSWDVAWLYIERLVQLLFFFHPVAWWATRQLSQARERCCDIQAVNMSNIKATLYWESVLNLLQVPANSSPRLAIASSLGRPARSLRDRIDAVRFHSHPHTRSRLAVYAGIMGLSTFLLPMAPIAGRAAIPLPTAKNDLAQSKQSALRTANDRVLRAREILDRYNRGDFGDRVITRPNGEAICAPDSWPAGVTCKGVFSRKDIGQLVWEAEDSLVKAERTAALLANP
ncbi:MAG: M56 family metallopeptidase [Candidatus Sphingomonas phytovorans]|nr:M56 family metallopeptidase [Sphingomonas sp.]WEK00339.1 MAG: M56 family metallopeptidase [Sphingomonas sp.]